MTDSASDRFKAELQSYLRARGQRALLALAGKVGEGVGKLTDPQGPPPALADGLTAGTEAMRAGKSPGKVVLAAGTSHTKSKVKRKAKRALGSGGRSGGSRTARRKGSGPRAPRRASATEDIDVGVPVDEALEQWLVFQESRRPEADFEEPDEEVPGRRIVWTAGGPGGTLRGVATFHRLADDLTRVLLLLEHLPSGPVGAASALWSPQSRRARRELRHFRRFLMLEDGEFSGGGEPGDEEAPSDDEVYEYDDAYDEDAPEAGAGGEYDETGYEDDAYDEDDLEYDEETEAEYDEDEYADEDGYESDDDDEAYEEDAGPDGDVRYEDDDGFEDDEYDADDEDETGDRRSVAAGR